MANSSRMNRGTLPRTLQLGLDKIIDDEGKEYRGVGERIFTEVKTEKAFYEFMKLAGAGTAARKGEGDAISWSSIDQHWVYRQPVYTYEKSARITEEMIEDNVYENVLPRLGREQLKALRDARDTNLANILNNATNTDYTYGDGSVLAATTHATQVGGTNSNRLATDADISEQALEDMVILIDNFVNDDGLKSNFQAKRLIVPTALRFEAKRILKNPSRPATSDRDINVLNMDGDIPEIVVWKRLTDDNAYSIQTDCGDGLLMIRRRGIRTKSAMDFETYDIKLTASERYGVTVGDHRCIVHTPGA